ncbi:ribonuclease z [hydrocarbon metagenome]|uniref:Ribonuclease z n=1 Tax=hydrocarbon metagenome TaxID=938273 RepID=A0A0W8E295_9ZZZZ
MNKILLQFLGSGDAFGSGNRLQSCIYVKTDSHKFLIDCGATSMVGLSQHQVQANEIENILISNLHGDHFGGVPYFIIDAQLNQKRKSPLMIAGPEGITESFHKLMEATFPGSSKIKTSFTLEIKEMEIGARYRFGDVDVLPWPVIHAPGDPHHALRIECGGKVIAYTGDTEWTENLIPFAALSDLLIIESYFYQKTVRYHLDFKTIEANAAHLQTKKLVLNHMSADMLRNLDGIAFEYSEDGRIFEL